MRNYFLNKDKKAVAWFLCVILVVGTLFAQTACAENSKAAEFDAWFNDDTPTFAPTSLPTVVPTITPTAEPTQAWSTEDSIGRYSDKYSVSVSTYRYDNQYLVSGDCAVDGNLRTAWNAYDRLAGEWIQLSVKDGRQYMIGGLRIASGYWKNSDVYNDNSCPKTVEIYCDGRYVQTIVLQHIWDYQTIWFDAPVTGSSIKLAVQDGYKGKTLDCCITEIELLGPNGNVLDPNTLDDWGFAVRKARARIESGGQIVRGDYGIEVVGLQLLLREGFGVLEGSVDGSFGKGTQAAVDALADIMRWQLPNCEPMRAGTVDSAYWHNLLAYMAMK